MRGSWNFRQGGPGQSDQKSSDNVFLVLSSEIYHSTRFQRGSNIFQGEGANFFHGGGGSNCLFPIEIHITCDFPGGSGPPVLPSGSALVVDLADSFFIRENNL